MINKSKEKEKSRRFEAALQSVLPMTYRLHRWFKQVRRRLLRKPRTMAEAPNLLPLLIQVLAAFTKIDGEVLEEEIDSILGFLRYDYPDAVYSELRSYFKEALREKQNLQAMANRLGSELSPDRKILLCVQLYDLISKAGMQAEQVQAYYAFMSQLGMASQAIDIVYQLNADGPDAPEISRDGSPLESLVFGNYQQADVQILSLSENESLNAYRYHELILLKNLSQKRVVVRGRPVPPGGLCRIYEGQRIIIQDQVITFQDLLFYFNAKKNVSLPQVYLTITNENEVQLERSRVRDSCLEVKFGLAVEVVALRDVEATLNDTKLSKGAHVKARLEDKIIFHNDSELTFYDLRRRARAMGGRFTLKASKSEYLVSNNPSLLEEDDILLSPSTSGDVLLKIFCDYDRKIGRVEVLQANRPILVRDTPVRNSATLQDGDLIRIDSGQVLYCDFTERIIEERRNIIRSLDLEDMHVVFPNGTIGIDSASFSLNRGEMVCVMGSSGSGKSTLLQSIGGQLAPTSGSIKLNGIDLYDNLDVLKGYISYIPQEDAFDEHLTIQENLEFAAAIRAPHLSRRDLSRRIDGKLVELGLSERRDSLVGSTVKKTLSGGERKRLNIGLDMISSSDIYLFDEPTSGLSSKDSEHVIEIIRGMAHNKIILVTIHQPSAKLFQMFNKALLLDKGGKVVFFGTPTEMLQYFAEAEHEQHFEADQELSFPGVPRPEMIFDVLETPLRDLSGDIIYEENNRGQLIPARRYSPDYWRDKFEGYRLLQDVRQVPLRKELPNPVLPAPINRTPRLRLRDEWTQLQTLLRRAFTSKLRNRANTLTTLVEAPLLAALIGAVLRYSESGTYDFASSFHIPTYLFLMLIVVMFLGLTNSADDIIRDRAILFRERNLNVRISYYILAKVLTLALFALLQCVFFILIGNIILEVRGMFWIYLSYAFTTAIGGIAIGLLISSIVSDAKTAVNIVPLILIPQIILGGALIKYEEMNRNLDFIYTIQRWFALHPESEPPRPQSELQVPLICEFMPMRWSYEALIVAQAKQNPLTSRQMKLRDLMHSFVAEAPNDPVIAEQLEETKDALAILSGLEADSPTNIDRHLAKIDRFLRNPTISASSLRSDTRGISAEQLYVNQKVTDLVSSAEMEQQDTYREGHINVFFGPEKYYFNRTWTVYTFNTAVLNITSITVLILLFFSLRHQLLIRIKRKR